MVHESWSKPSAARNLCGETQGVHGELACVAAAQMDFSLSVLMDRDTDALVRAIGLTF
jgi:hypothetical protein